MLSVDPFNIRPMLDQLLSVPNLPKLSKILLVILVIFLILHLMLLLILLFRAGYTAQWTGFGGYDKVTREYSLDGKLAKTTREYQPKKILWDWLQLLIIPVLLAAGVLWFNYHQDQLSHQLATDQQQETTLETYMDKISELLTDKHLKDPSLGIEAQVIARARTLIALGRCKFWNSVGETLTITWVIWPL